MAVTSKEFQRSIVCFLIVLVLHGTAWSYFVMNPSSEPLALPVQIYPQPLAQIKDGTYRIVSSDDRQVDVDVIRGRFIVWCPLKAFESIEFQPKAEQSGVRIPVLETNGMIQVTAGAVQYQIFHDGSMKINVGTNEWSALFLSGQPRLTFSGATTVMIEFGEERSREVFSIYPSGMARFEGKTLAFETDPEAMRIRTVSDGVMGPSKIPESDFVDSPLDWVFVQPDGGEAGLALLPIEGTSMEIHSGVVDIHGGMPEVMFLPVPSVRDAWKLPVSAHGALLMHGDGDKFMIRHIHGYGRVDLAVLDRNTNGYPDVAGDLWYWNMNLDNEWDMVMASSAPSESRAARWSWYPLGENTQMEAVLDEYPDIPASAEASAVHGMWYVEDADGDGIPLRGNIFYGGWTASDRTSRDGIHWARAWDLNRDGFGDLFERPPADYAANPSDNPVTPFRVQTDVFRCSVRGFVDMPDACDSSFACVSQHQVDGSQNACSRWEEQIRIRRQDSEVPVDLFYSAKDMGKNIRLAAGGLPGSKAKWSIDMETLRFLDDTAKLAGDWTPPAGTACGRPLVTLDPSWDGGILENEKVLRAWHLLANGQVPTKRTLARLAPVDDNSGQRLEVNRSGGPPAVYFSSIMGGWHVVGAQNGAELATSSADFSFGPCDAYPVDALAGPLPLLYFDADMDGFFDCYLVDQNRDGAFERSLNWQRDAGIFSVSDDGQLAAWPWVCKPDVIPFGPDAIRLITEAGHEGEDALVDAMLLQNTVVPDPAIMHTNVYAVLGHEWGVRVAGLRGEGSSPWGNWETSGSALLGATCQKAGLTPVPMTLPVSSRFLRECDIMVWHAGMPVPDKRSLRRIQKWVRRGGILVLVGSVDPNDVAAVDQMTGGWNIRIGVPEEDGTEDTGILDIPGWGLLDDIRYLDFAPQRVLEWEQGDQPVLMAGRYPVLLEAPRGEGKIFALALDLASNRALDLRAGFLRGIENDRLLARILTRLAEHAHVPKMKKLTYSRGTLACQLEGRGGDVYLPVWLSCGKETGTLSTVTVNGQDVAWKTMEGQACVQLPQGASCVSAVYEEPTSELEKK